MRRLGVVILGIAFSALASMQSSYEEGRVFAESGQKQVQKALSEAKPTQVPGFETETPPETNLDKGGNFEEATRLSLTRNEAGKQVIESAKIRPRIVIDPKTHPLFQTADAQSPEAMLNIPSEPEAAQSEGPVEKTCEEGGEAIRYECIEHRYVMPKIPPKTTTLWVDHLAFTAHMESYSIPGRSGGMFRHGKEASTGQRQNGYNLTLPKDIKAFKEAFCPKFTGIDAKTHAVFPVDCSSIESYQINPAESLSHAQDSVSIHVSAAMVNVSLFHRTYEKGDEIDEWRSNCGPFEDMVAQGLCHYGERVLIEGAATKNIAGYPMTRDDWQYRQIYDCQMVKDECSPLRAQRCYQTGSRCKEQREGKCWIFQQSYQCPSVKLSGAQFKSPSLGAFCLTGDCHDHSYQANNELLDVMARLNVLKEVEDDIHGKKDHFEIFKGHAKQCSRNCINFKDCCGGLKGWGMSFGLAGCHEDEKLLSKMRAQHLCYATGTFCSNKKLGKCLSKKSTFCCFGSRLARLVHEQGRPQIGMGWGSAREPQCQGLSVEQFSRMDLSNMNFSEIFEDVIQKYHKTDTQPLQQKTQEQIKSNLSTIEQGFRDKTVGSQSGKLNADQKNF